MFLNLLLRQFDEKVYEKSTTILESNQDFDKKLICLPALNGFNAITALSNVR